MAEERKDAALQIRLSSKLLSQFKLKCANSTPRIVSVEWLINNNVKK